MSNLITEIYDKQAVVDNLNQLGELINSSLNAIVASAPKLQSPIEYLTAVQSISEIEKKNTEVTQAKAKALGDLDKAYQQADKAIQQSINLDDAEFQAQTKLTSQYKERAKEQKQLLELERTRQQTMQNGTKLLQMEAKSEGELRMQQQQLIKAQQSLRVTNAEENALREKLIAKINANKEALKGMSDEVSKQRDNIGNYISVWDALADGQTNVRSALQMTRQEMSSLEALKARDGKLSAEQEARYKELNVTMGKLTDIQGDMSSRAKALANDYLGLNTALEGVKLGANSLAAVQSATAMLGVENEELVATIQKVQAAQAFANSVNEIAKSLNKDSALVQGLRVVKEKLLTTAIGEQTKAQLALNAAKLGLIGLLAGAVTGLAIWIAKMASAKAQVADLTKTINEQAVDAVAPTIQKVNDLKDRWSELGGDLEAQKQFIKDNAGAFDELGISLTNVNDAEKFFSDQTQDFIDAQINRAKAEAARAQMTEIIKQQLTAQLEYERKYIKGQKTFVEGVVDGYSQMKMGAVEYALLQRIAFEQDQKQYDEQIKSLSEMANGFDEIANKLTANIPTKDKHTEATKKQTEAIKEYNSEIEKTLDIQTELFKQWDEQEKQAKKLADMLAKAKSEMADFEIEEEEAVEPVKTLSELIKEQEQIVKERTEAVKEAKENLTEAFEAITQSQLDNLERQSDAYDENYERRKQAIENTVMSEEEKDRRLKALDNEKTAHDRQVARQRAEIERRQAIFQNAIASAEAMSKAVASVGELLATSAGGDPYTAIARYIAAISAGVTAVTTIASLISQLVKIPAFEKGGTAQANKPFIAGEKGREIGFGVYSGKVYDFSKPTLFKANEPINIKNANETRQIINNNEYNKDVTLHNEISVQVIDNTRINKFFKIW